MEWTCSNPRCRKLLDIDDSLLDIDLSNLKSNLPISELLDYLQNIPEVEKEKRGTLRQVPITKLFEVAADLCAPESDIPLCKECAQKQLKSLEVQLQETLKESSSYELFLSQINSQLLSGNSSTESELDKDIKEVKTNYFVIYNC